ncbi:MAG: hypothetical protein U0326_33810 [Polyangiales bacterium]
MSEPRRWLDDPDGAPDDVRALLREATPTRAPDAAALARVTERVTVATALGGVTAAGVTWWKVGALTLGLAASVAVLAPRKSHPPPAPIARPVAAVVRPVAAPVVAPSVVQVERPSVAPPAPASSAARVVRVTPVVTAPRRVVAMPAPSLPTVAPTLHEAPAPGGGGHVATAGATDALAEEARWIEDARRSLDGDPSSALRTLRTYPARFPRGQLQGEVRYLTFEALRRSGAPSEARAFGEQMLREAPQGPYARRIRSALAVTDMPF